MDGGTGRAIDNDPRESAVSSRGFQHGESQNSINTASFERISS